MTNYPQQVFGLAMSLIFPVRCIECGRFSTEKDKRYLCLGCSKSIPVRKNFECIGCKDPSPLGKTCISCRDKFSIDNLLIISDYKNKVIERAIKTLKYRFIPEIATCLQPMIKRYIVWLKRDRGLNLFENSPLLVPIPLHKTRLNWRGFNQAELIAEILAQLSLTEINSEILFRNTASKPQAEIENKDERIKNLEKVFSIEGTNQIIGRTIILIDDICTTGTTLNEAAKILKTGGASKVVGFVIARG